MTYAVFTYPVSDSAGDEDKASGVYSLLGVSKTEHATVNSMQKNSIKVLKSKAKNLIHIYSTSLFSQCSPVNFDGRLSVQFVQVMQQIYILLRAVRGKFKNNIKIRTKFDLFIYNHLPNYRFNLDKNVVKPVSK